MPLINQIIAQYLPPSDMVGIGNELGIWVQEGPPDSMARSLVEGARQRLRLDVVFTRVKGLRPQIDLTPNLHELVAATFSQEEMVDLCHRLGLDSRGLGLDAGGLIGWGFDPYLQRKKAELVQANSETAAFLTAIAQVKPKMELTAFGKTAAAVPTSTTAVQSQVEKEPLPTKPPKSAYENIDLTVSRIDQTYTVEINYSRGGGDKVVGTKVNIGQDTHVQNLLVNLDLLSGDLDEAEKVGRLMRESLFPPAIWSFFTTAKGNAKDRYNSGLRMRLRIEPPEIGMLPWEYCFDKDMEFLALNRDLPMVRYIEKPFIPDDVLAPRPARVLLASASPSDFDPIDAAEEAEYIHNELQPLVGRGELEIRHLHPATLDEFQSEMVRFRPHILHFIGHGTFDIDRGRGALIFEKKDHTSHALSSRQLAGLLRGTDVKVIILNACKTATHDAANAFMGLAPALVGAEVPAVIAMQFAMPDDTAARFARQIYHFLAMGLPLDRAITEARINLYTYDEENIFWAVPVLFMRSPDGVIWQEREE